MSWSETARKTPDELLAQIARAENPRGKLKLFLGAAAGVGKTYRMLDEARTRKRDGTDVVLGWIETHGRAETQAVLDSTQTEIPQIPPRAIEYKGAILQEMDLDAILQRKPQLV